MKVSLIIFLIGFITIAPSIYLGIKYFDGKVTDQPYETGLQYDTDKKFITDNGLELNILNMASQNGQVEMAFTIAMNEGAGMENTSFFITRPATAQGTISVETQKNAEGIYSTAFNIDTKGYHILKVVSRVNGKDVTLQKSFYIN
jgi:nitrogen fixation protein FixH